MFSHEYKLSNICTFTKIEGNFLKRTSAGHKVITELFKSKGRIDGAAKKKAPYPTQTGELMVPSIANTYTIEILQYVSMTSSVQSILTQSNELLIVLI